MITKHIDSFLERLLASIDITEEAYSSATKRYQSVGAFLDREQSSVAQYHPEIYPQGSFLLGTVTRPVNDNDDYDIDLVCNLTVAKSQISQKALKSLVGDELAAYVKQEGLDPINEGQRCWTVLYTDTARFHLDILPAIPDSQTYQKVLQRKELSETDAARLSKFAIAITDKTKANYDRIDSDWHVSHPRGYALWFRQRIKTAFEQKRKQLADAIGKSVEGVPSHLVKTPLQRVVQVLKRHRDLLFIKEPKFKPISSIITTLAAQAYSNEDSILEALVNVVSRIPELIEVEGGEVWIRNPVNPAENFADKWPDDARLKEAFGFWLDSAQNHLVKTLASGRVEFTAESLKPLLGFQAVNKALESSPHGEIGLREVSLLGSRLPAEKIEITPELLCKCILLDTQDTVSDALSKLHAANATYALFIDNSEKIVLGIIRPEHLVEWASKKVDPERLAFELSDKQAAFVRNVLEKESQRLLRLKKVLIDHHAVVVMLGDGSFGVLDKDGYGRLMERIDEILIIKDLQILRPDKKDEAGGSG